MKYLNINPDKESEPTRDRPAAHRKAESVPPAKSTKVHPQVAGDENASLYFVGTATTILSDPLLEFLHGLLALREWHGIRILTDVGWTMKN